MTVLWVPGAFELPLAVDRVLRGAGEWDAALCLGALVRGETPHFEVLAHAVASAIESVGLETGKPVIFGVLTCDTLQQAVDRSGGAKGNKGSEAAVAAIEMVRLYSSLTGD